MRNPRPVRYRCELFAQLETDQGVPAKARLLEISEGGAFVEEAAGLEDLQVGDGATLGLALPGGEPWMAHAKVSRHGTSRLDLRHGSVDHVTVLARGYALEFDEMPEDELERLRDFLELLDGR
ncbi:MAG: PilZ domain-containing protein [Myxococcota bacterium]